MTDHQTTGVAGWKIVLSIYAKDFVDAFRNWATLTVIAGITMVLFTAQAGSLLAKLVDQDIVIAYDPDRSSLLREMRRLESPSVVAVESLEKLQLQVGDAPDVRIGVVIPPGADETLEDGQPVVLEVLYAHWADPEEASVLVDTLDRRLSAQTGHSFEFRVLTERAYPMLEQAGRSQMVSSALVIGVLTIGTFLTPYLLAEEKEEGTLAMLMLSPATESQIVAAKALVGMTYCLIVGGVSLILMRHFVVHAWLSVLAILSLSLFAVCLGLLIGLIVKQLSTINLWMGVALLLLIVPTVFIFLDGSSMPRSVIVLMDWIPTVATNRLLRISFLEKVRADFLLQPISALLIASAISFVALVYKLRREDRE